MNELAEINNKDWEIIKKLLKKTVRIYYGWNTKKSLEGAKEVNKFVDMIIKKVEAEKGRP